jgi:hypothetical protein
MAEQLNYQINVSGNAGESVGSLKKQLREATAEVAILSDKFGATSKEAIEAAKRAAELRDRIGDARALTEAFNPDAKFKALTASLSGVAGGFAAVQGAIGLFGSESKELEKQLLKVQSALALSQGLQSIGESIDSFKQLGAVIQSTTLFTRANSAANVATAATMKALGIAVDTTAVSFRVLKTAIAATGIGLAVLAIGELISAISTYTSAAEKAKEAQDKLNASITKSAEGALQAEIDQINRSNDLLIAQAKLRGASEKEIFEIEQTSRKLRIAARNRFNKEVANTDKEAADKNLSEIRKEQDAIVLSDVNYKIAEKERKKKHNEELKALEKQRTEDERKERAERNQNVRNQIIEDNKTFLKNVDNERKEQIKNTDAVVKGSLEANLQAVGAASNVKKKIAEDEQEQDDTKLKYEKAKRDAYAMTADSLGVLSEVVGQQTAAGKALSSAQALINTFLGITQIWANKTVIPEPFGTIQKVAATTTAAASGFLAVRNINKVNVPKGGGGASVPSFTAAPLTPSNASLLTTSLSQQTINAIGNSAIRAYVVETDITSNQKRIQAIKQRARFS